ncbi:MAG: hypothetical protein WBW25_00430, partial [Halobacteriota archaeon]
YHIIECGVVHCLCDFRVDPQECLLRQPTHALVFRVGGDRFNIALRFSASASATFFVFPVRE